MSEVPKVTKVVTTIEWVKDVTINNANFSEAH